MYVLSVIGNLCYFPQCLPFAHAGPSFFQPPIPVPGELLLLFKVSALCPPGRAPLGFPTPSCFLYQSHPQGAGVSMPCSVSPPRLGASQEPGITQHDLGTERVTWKGLVTQELAEGVRMPNPEGLPQGGQTTIFSTILELWGSRKGFKVQGQR